MKLDFINNSFNRFDIVDGASAAANTALPGSGAVVSFISNLFASKPNPNDWKGWNAQDAQAGRPIGSSAVWWIITDGDSVRNEADNAQSYIKNYPGGKGLEVLLTAAQDQYGKTSQEFLEAFTDKLKRAGYANEANSVSSFIKTNPLTGSNAPGVLAQNLQTAPATVDKTPEQIEADTKSKNQVYIIIAVVVVAVLLGVGLYLLRKKK